MTRIISGAATAAAGSGNVWVATAAGAVAPLVEAIVPAIGERWRRRQLDRVVETIAEAATEAGATDEESLGIFLERLLGDDDREELFIRVVKIAQDTAMSDKRRALSRVLANAVADVGVRVDGEIALTRVIDDLAPADIRVLRIMGEASPRMAKYATDYGLDPMGVRSWQPTDITVADPGLADAVWGSLNVLRHHQLIHQVAEYVPSPYGDSEDEYRISGYGDYLLKLLAVPDDDDLAPDRLR